MKENKEEINHFDYGYELGKKLDFDANSMMLIAKFLGEVVEKETNVFAGITYPKSVREIKDDNGNIIKVQFDEITEHESPTSFLMTAADSNGGFLGLTSTGVKASQILSAILTWHEENINKGKAIKLKDLNEKRVFES